MQRCCKAGMQASIGHSTLPWRHAAANGVSQRDNGVAHPEVWAHAGSTCVLLIQANDLLTRR